MADFYDLREVVTGNFYERHVVVVNASSSAELSERDLEDCAKKLAEGVYQSRGVAISSVLVLGRSEVLTLKGEVKTMQQQYEIAEAGKIFTTRSAYPHLARGSREGTPAAKKRASALGSLRFKYAAEAVQGEHGPRFKICHYDGIA